MAARQHRIKYWTVLETRSASSAVAVRHVSQQGFTYYHPQYRQMKFNKNGIFCGVRPVRALFPNYLFVEINPRRSEWQRLHSTRGVYRVMMTGLMPGRVRDSDIDYLRGLEDDMGYVVPVHEAPPVFAEGDDVVVRATTARAKYVGLGSRRNTRKILYSMFGQDLEIETSVHDIEHAPMATF